MIFCNSVFLFLPCIVFQIYPHWKSELTHWFWLPHAILDIHNLCCPPGLQGSSWYPLLELPWEVFLEVELLNHRVCVFAAQPASADLFSKVFALIYSSNVSEFLLLHILNQCLVLLDFLIFANPIGCGMTSHNLASSAYLWSLLSWTLFQVFAILRSHVQ